jgi:gentisate 1,2-dioxygenase
MQPGDFVITPSWTWHDHGNETKEPMVWLDGLDIQLVKLLGASFAEGYPEDTQPVSRPEGDSFARFGHNLLPVDWKPEVKTSPVFNYPYARTREALGALGRNGAPDPYHGYKLRYVNPASGEFAMPTIATFVQLLPAGFASQPYRSTDGTVFVVVEGTGETRIGDTKFVWEPHDIFVVPSWMKHTHHGESEAVLFSFSDRVVQEKLGLWREARGNA